MSEFLKESYENDKEKIFEINFEEMVPLPKGGSTCDIYRTRWHRREVFIKRLKEEYRFNPLYLDAIYKEFEIGVSLKHPSLPDYREFHRDYIIMDFIDGQSLAQLINQHDPWLKNEKNIIKLLKELINVIDYLHRHNVTHCDIKPDNIMITSNNHNLILIDFDKSYTDSLNDTSGNPSMFGLNTEQKGKINLDFFGLAQVVKKIMEGIPDAKFSRFSTFLKTCQKNNVTADELLQLLDYDTIKISRKFYWLVTFAPFVVALIFGGIIWLKQDRSDVSENNGVDEPVTDSLDTIYKVSIENPRAVVPPLPVTQEELLTRAKEMALQLDKRIRPLFDELNLSLDNLKIIIENNDLDESQLITVISKHDDMENEYCQEAFEILNDMYPNLTEREAWRIMAFSKEYTNYKKRVATLYKKLDQEPG